MITSPTALLRAALVAFAGLSLPNPAALALVDQTSPTAFIVGEDFAPLRHQWQPASGTWSIRSGTYNSTAAGIADIATMVAYRAIDPATPPSPALSFERFTVSARVRARTAGMVGVVYQYQDPANYYAALISTNGLVSLRRVRFGSADQLATRNLGIQRDTWYVVEVQWNNGLTTLSINGQPIFTGITQLEFKSGQVGLMSQEAVGQYDKVQVTTPFGDQPFKHDFSTDAPGWTPQSGQWNTLNGAYKNAAVQQTSVTLAPIDTGTLAHETSEYTLHARMLNPYGASGNLVGIVFNYAGSSYTEVVFSPTGVAKMNRVSSGRVQTLATAAYPGRSNVWFDVTLDNTASVWVDGERIFDHVPGANPDLAPQGGIGLITHWAPGRFDDVWFDHGRFRPCTETFSSGPVPDVASGTWTVSTGTLNATSVNASSIALPCRTGGNFAGADAGTDFVYGARLFNPYGASGNLVGLIFNYQHPLESLYAGDYYELVFSPTGSAFLNKFIQGVRYRVGTFPHNVPRNTWFDVQLFRSGIFTTFKVNGTTVARDIPQGELRGGGVGVVTHWSPGRFDNLSLQPYVVRSAPVTYTLTHIATPPPDSERGQFQVFDINDAGEVVGSRVGEDGTQQAFVWRDGAFRNLNPFLPAGLHRSGVRAINNQSDVIGSYQDQQFQDQPFFLSASGQSIPLTGLPSGIIDLIDLNDRREILLSARTGSVRQYFIWRSGQLTALQNFPPNTQMTAVAMNNEGAAVGYGGIATPVLWEGGTVMPLALPEGADNSIPAAINDHRAVAATAFIHDTFPARTATYIWHEGETTVLTPPPPLTHSVPRHMNNRSVVVGTSLSPEGGTAPTVWDGTRGQDLNTLIDRQDPRQPFVRLNVPHLINNRGQIVAHGIDSRRTDGRSSSYLLTPVAAQ